MCLLHALGALPKLLTLISLIVTQYVPHSCMPSAMFPSYIVSSSSSFQSRQYLPGAIFILSFTSSSESQQIFFLDLREYIHTDHICLVDHLKKIWRLGFLFLLGPNTLDQFGWLDGTEKVRLQQGHLPGNLNGMQLTKR